MQLKCLQLQGFKSFPDKTIINFSSGITAIVGPNGSGKSNIGDALRWVMGETSNKTLRSDKMEDVIFDGTCERKPLGFAEVQMILDNSDKTLNIDYDEVSISRRYYRSGESEYYLNKNNVRLKDIRDLLMDTGLGKQGYSIIGQGAVTEIIEAKSTDRRFLFEEAAGISKFKYKKDEALRKLEKTQDNIIRVNDIINELEDRLIPLQEQADKAKKFVSLREEKKNLELSIWSDRLKEIDLNLEHIKETNDSYNTQLKTCCDELSNNEFLLSEKQSLTEKTTSEIEDMRTNLKILEEQIQNKQTGIVVLKNDIEHLINDLAKTEQTLNQTNEISETDSIELQNKISEKNNAITEADKIRNNINLIQNEIDTYEKNYLSQRDSADKLQNSIDNLKNNITSMRIQLSATDQSIENDKTYIQDRHKEMDDANERINSIFASQKNIQSQITDLTSKIKDAQNIESGYKEKQINKNDKYNELNKTYIAISNELTNKSNRLSILSGMEKHYEGFQNSIKKIMEEKKRSILKGIVGTVSDIIEVNNNYSTAIETALAGSLQNIVTEDERAAKSAILYLKTNNLGRATFLPIESIKGTRLNIPNLKGENGFIGIACNLIKYENQYSGIIDYLLGRTVVCEDLDCAAIIARKNKYSFRIVTLDGQVINAGGSFTGGSTVRNFGILSRHNEIESLVKDCQNLSSQTDTIEKNKKQLQQQIDEVAAIINASDSEINNLKQTLIIAQENLKHYESYKDTMSQQHSAISEEINKLEQINNKHIYEKNILIANIKDLEKQSADLDNDLLSINAKITEITKNRDLYIENRHSIEISLAEKQKNIGNLDFCINQINQKLNEYHVNINSLTNQTEIINKNIEDNNAKVSQYYIDKEDMDKEVISIQDNIQKHISSRTGFEQEIQKMRDREKELYSIKEKLSIEIDKHDSFIKNLDSEHDSIIAKIWDEYELTYSETESLHLHLDDKDEALHRVNSIKSIIRSMGNINLSSIDEYSDVKNRYDNLNSQVMDLEKARTELEKLINELTKQMVDVFSEKFKIINEEFKHVFKELFGGGNSELTLDNPSNVLESGIDIYAAPPGKVVKNLMLLSGGERSLTAIALYFAILKIKPAPFCLLDEIEAALDDVNVSRYASYLHKHDKTQFIAITHRRGTMESADSIYGVTMSEKGVSKVLSVNINEIAHEYK